MPNLNQNSIDKAIGSDIIEIERLQNAIERHKERFLDRIFTKREQSYCLKHKNSMVHFAGRYAAKEAIAKSFGTGFGLISFKDLEILNDDFGKPYLVISKKLKELFSNPKVCISISHCKSYAMAIAYRDLCK